MVLLLVLFRAKVRSHDAGSVAGPLGKVARTLGIQSIPVDDPGAAKRLRVVMDDVGIGKAEAEAGNRGEGLASGAGYGMIQLVLRHRLLQEN